MVRNFCSYGRCITHLGTSYITQLLCMPSHEAPLSCCLSKRFHLSCFKAAAGLHGWPAETPGEAHSAESGVAGLVQHGHLITGCSTKHGWL